MKIVEVAKEIKGNAIDLSEDTLDYNAALHTGWPCHNHPKQISYNVTLGGTHMAATIIIWVLCSAFAYAVAAARAPSKAGLAAILGLLLGPIGVGIAFFLRD